MSLIATLLLFTVFAAMLALGGLLVTQERARVRDARRIVDMTRVQFGFESLFRETGSYADAAAGCRQAGDDVATCAIGTFVPTISTLTDPGRFDYRVEQVPDGTNFVIGFTLERSYDSLAAGKHTLSKDGIR